jgi:hypothetical protein
MKLVMKRGVDVKFYMGSERKKERKKERKEERPKERNKQRKKELL